MAQHTFHTLNPEQPVRVQKTGRNIVPMVIVITVAIISGLFSGMVFANSKKNVSNQTGEVTMKQGTGINKNSFGTKNTKRFPDTAEGILKKGGTEGEGTHHLERKGGPSQNVYITSSSVNLDQFLNKKVKVWGKTYAAQTAGWLMDIGYLESQ